MTKYVTLICKICMRPGIVAISEENYARLKAQGKEEDVLTGICTTCRKEFYWEDIERNKDTE